MKFVIVLVSLLIAGTFVETTLYYTTEETTDWTITDWTVTDETTRDEWTETTRDEWTETTRDEWTETTRDEWTETTRDEWSETTETDKTTEAVKRPPQEILKDIYDGVDKAVSDSVSRHKQIMDVSVAIHEAIKNERKRLHEELRKDREKQFQEFMDMRDKDHEELKMLMKQTIESIVSTYDKKIDRFPMDVMNNLKKAVEDYTTVNKKQTKELENLHKNQHAELQQLKDTEGKQIVEERNNQFAALNRKIASQKGELLKISEEAAATIQKIFFFQHCDDIYTMQIRENGEYPIKSIGMEDVKNVYCDMENDGGGWTVIQRRDDFVYDQDNFDRTWLDYKRGFGNISGEFWIGNDALHHLTKDKPFQLHIEMTDYQNVTTKAHFGRFQVGSESDRYRLTLRDGAANQKNYEFLKSDGHIFTTSDVQQDPACGQKFAIYSGWWYHACGYEPNLNNLHGYRSDRRIVITFEDDHPLSSVVMKIKPSYG